MNDQNYLEHINSHKESDSPRFDRKQSVLGPHEGIIRGVMGKKVSTSIPQSRLHAVGVIAVDHLSRGKYY